MEELSINEKAKRYDEAIQRARNIVNSINVGLIGKDSFEAVFPELKESEDERIKKELICFLETEIPQCNARDKYIAWLEKQGSEPNWCHHKVDLSECSEEYRKAYYDGWNNCNMQHSQCKSELDDVVKCLINGMKFYYEDNEKATWGTDKWSMPVKHIIEILEKQDEHADFISKIQVGDKVTRNEDGVLVNLSQLKRVAKKDEKQDEQKSYASETMNEKWDFDSGFTRMMEKEQKHASWSEDDENNINSIVSRLEVDISYWESRSKTRTNEDKKLIEWLKFLKDRYIWKPSDEQIKVCKEVYADILSAKGFDLGTINSELNRLEEDLKKLKG